MEIKAVYKAISAVAKALAAQGIKKDKRNAQQGFMFRGIDQVYTALAPALVEHGLLILPRIVDRSVTERTTKTGNALFYVTIKAEFDFVAVEDGSTHTVVTFGEAMDSGDKATNKAMSIAYKYAAFQAFCIPTEETAIDADAECHEVEPDQPKPAGKKASRSPDELLSSFAEWAMTCNDSAGLTRAYNALSKKLAAYPEQAEKAHGVYQTQLSDMEQPA